MLVIIFKKELSAGQTNKEKFRDQIRFKGHQFVSPDMPQFTHIVNHELNHCVCGRGGLGVEKKR